MAKFNVIEKYYYEIEADCYEDAVERHQQFMEAGEDDEELGFDAKFIDNQLDVFDADWNEVKI
jgi:hypothetical protein